MKRVIKLTESNLHKIITESVRQYITELDWKTYMSAAEKQSNKPEKRNRRGFYDGSGKERWRRFKQAAADALRDQYGDERTVVQPDRDMNHLHNMQVTDRNWRRELNNGIGDYVTRHKKYPTDDNVYVHTSLKYDSPDSFMGNHKFSEEGMDNHFSPEVKQTIDRVQDEYDAYKNGEYEYVNGKGWQLKDESKIRNAVRESLRRLVEDIDGDNHIFEVQHITPNMLRHLWVFETGDSYYDFEAVYGDVSFRGYYASDGLHVDEVIIGHSGAGREMDERDLQSGQFEQWFNDTLKDSLTQRVEMKIENGDFSN